MYMCNFRSTDVSCLPLGSQRTSRMEFHMNGMEFIFIHSFLATMGARVVTFENPTYAKISHANCHFLHISTDLEIYSL